MKYHLQYHLQYSDIYRCKKKYWVSSIVMNLKLNVRTFSTCKHVLFPDEYRRDCNMFETRRNNAFFCSASVSIGLIIGRIYLIAFNMLYSKSFIFIRVLIQFGKIYYIWLHIVRVENFGSGFIYLDEYIRYSMVWQAIN